MKKTVLILGIIFLLLGTSFVSSTYTITKDTHTNYQPIESIDISKKTMSRGKTAYAYNTYASGISEGPCYFDLDDPGTVTSFEILNCPFFGCGTWTNNGKWLVCNYTGALWEINLCNNTASKIGGGGVHLTGLSYNPWNDKLYGCTSYDLYEISMSTGEQTYIGSFGIGYTIIAIAINSEGRAFIWDVKFSGSSILWEVDLETGEATQVGSLGMTLCYAQDGAFDYETDTLYLSAYIYSPEYGGYLVEVDIETAETTIIGYFQGSAELVALAIPYSDDVCPPNTTISYNPPEPDGDNGWYVSNVTVMLNATDENGVYATYYRVDGGKWQTYYSPFIIVDEGKDILIDFYSVDNIGNVEDVKYETLDIDKTPPEMIVNISKIKIEWQKWRIIISATCTDILSGIPGSNMRRVEFYLNGVLHDTVTGPGPEYIWSFMYGGGLKITIGVGAHICDIAGNCDDVYNETEIYFSRNKNQLFTNQILLRFIDYFPFLQRVLDIWRFNIL